MEPGPERVPVVELPGQFLEGMEPRVVPLERVQRRLRSTLASVPDLKRLPLPALKRLPLRGQNWVPLRGQNWLLRVARWHPMRWLLVRRELLG